MVKTWGTACLSYLRIIFTYHCDVLKATACVFLCMQGIKGILTSAALVHDALEQLPENLSGKQDLQLLQWWRCTMEGTQMLTSANMGRADKKQPTAPPASLQSLCGVLVGLFDRLAARAESGLQLEVPHVVRLGGPGGRDVIQEKVLQDASIVLSTVSMAGSRAMDSAGLFAACLVDEAAQLVGAETSIVKERGAGSTAVGAS